MRENKLLVALETKAEEQWDTIVKRMRKKVVHAIRNGRSTIIEQRTRNNDPETGPEKTEVVLQYNCESFLEKYVVSHPNATHVELANFCEASDPYMCGLASKDGSCFDDESGAPDLTRMAVCFSPCPSGADSCNLGSFINNEDEIKNGIPTSAERCAGNKKWHVNWHGFVDRITTINLKRRLDRKAFMKTMLRTVGAPQNKTR
jgi:hypothetical protein